MGFCIRTAVQGFSACLPCAPWGFGPKLGVSLGMHSTQPRHATAANGWGRSGQHQVCSEGMAEVVACFMHEGQGPEPETLSERVPMPRGCIVLRCNMSQARYRYRGLQLVTCMCHRTPLLHIPALCCLSTCKVRVLVHLPFLK